MKKYYTTPMSNLAGAALLLLALLMSATASYAINGCSAPTSGGTITATTTTICYGGTVTVTNETAASNGNGTGTLTYTWQINTASTTFEDIPGAVSETYEYVGTLTQTTWFRRLALVCDEGQSVNWESAASSNVIKITVQPYLIYRSATTGSWSDTTTWEQAIVENPNGDGDWAAATSFPGEITNDCPSPQVTILVGHSMEILTGSTIDIPNLKVEAGGKLTIKSGGKIFVQEKLQLDQSAGAAIVVESSP